MDSQPSSTPNVDRWLEKNLQDRPPLKERLAAAERRIDQLEVEIAATRKFLLAMIEEVPMPSGLANRLREMTGRAAMKGTGSI